MDNEQNIPAQIAGDVEYSMVALTEEQRKDGNPAKSGIVIDGVTARINDVSLGNEEEQTLNIDYAIVDGYPDDLRFFESQLSKVMMYVIDSYMQE